HASVRRRSGSRRPERRWTGTRARRRASASARGRARWPGSAGRPPSGTSGTCPGTGPPRQEVFLQEADEEFLRQVLGILGGMATAADEGVERIPVRLAQLLQRLSRLGRGAVARRQHQAPPGGAEALRRTAGIKSGFGAAHETGRWSVRWRCFPP